MDTGIGKDGYSIIGQGRIDEILSDNSEERRKVFEEAIFNRLFSSFPVFYRYSKIQGKKKRVY